MAKTSAVPVGLAVQVLATKVFLKLSHLRSLSWNAKPQLSDDQAMTNTLIALRVMIWLPDAKQALELRLPDLDWFQENFL